MFLICGLAILSLAHHHGIGREKLPEAPELAQQDPVLPASFQRPNEDTDWSISKSYLF